jgi:hypothetical protein
VIWGALGLVAAAVAAAVGAWLLRDPKSTDTDDKPKSRPDMLAVLKANNRGVGYMEQYDFAEAVPVFEQVVDMAPDWLPGRINLGIALLNQQGEAGARQKTSPNLEKARAVFEEILRQDKDNPYAHYCLGIILVNEFPADEAVAHFKAVTRIDPKDAYSWYRLGSILSQQDADAEALECFERARKLDPYLIGATHGLAMALRRHDVKKSMALLNDNEALKQAEWGETGRPNRYSEMGPYADVIGRPPDVLPPAHVGPLPAFAPGQERDIRLAPKARWATAADLGKDVNAELRARIRERFGATMVALDYNRDGKPDLFLLGAVVEAGKVRDLLLRNDGNGHFTDITAEMGLAEPRPSLGCCVADFDNNGYPDLFITGIGRQWLFRNTGKHFEDVTAEAGLDKLKSVCLGSAFVDLDQDGDLDLVVAQYSDTAEHALAMLKGEKPDRGAGLAVYLNVGEAPAKSKSADPPPLKPKFRRVDKPDTLPGPAVPAIGLAVTDLDLDQDLDLLILADRTAPAMVLNDRLLRFHRAALPESLVGAGQWNGALVFDVNRDQRSDLLLVGPGRRPALLVHQPLTGRADPRKWFVPGSIKSPPLLQAQATDIDLDGWTDVVGLSAEHRPVLLHNRGGKLVQIEDGLGSDKAWPKDLVAVTVADFNGDGFPDLMVWSETKGLRLHTSLRNGNHGLKLEFSGHRRVEPAGGIVRCTAEGFGVCTSAQTADQWTDAEYTTLSAGLGQSLQPLVLGLGKYREVGVVRLHWPDLCSQAEFNVAVNQIQRIEEANRKGESCPILFAWDGERFGFVTDFLGAGSLGETGPDGSHRPPRPEESVKIEAKQLVPLDDHYVLKLAEPMNEVTYLDRLRLLVLDHPADVRVYPDERFAPTDPPASQDLFAFRQEIYPVRARDHHGHDVTRTLRAWDRDTVRDFARRSWAGFAEDHWVELDFGDRLAHFGPHDRLLLCLAGWTDYAYPESIWAANQAGIVPQYPVLERLEPDGKWRPVVEPGFPAGLPRMMTLDVTGKLGGPRCVVRLRTNMQVYWDQVFVAPLLERVPKSMADEGAQTSRVVRVTPLEVASATLSAHACMQEYSPDGRQPTLYDYDRTEAVPLSPPAGRLTRRGDVTELLRDRDDRFVIFGPGDEVTVRFDARRLPALPPGWQRDFVLRTWGYCKDSGPFTATGETVEPLPFRAMRNYPYGPDEHYPCDAAHQDYLRRFNTRRTSGERP